MRFLIFMSGARPDLLDRFPAERDTYAALGCVVLCAGVFPSVLVAYGLYAGTAMVLPLAIAFGLGMAFLFLSLDRWLVMSSPTDTRRMLMTVGLRAMLGILLALPISVLLSLQIFSSEVSLKAIEMRQQAATAFQHSTHNVTLAKQINVLKDRISNYQRIIATNGTVQLNPAKDGILASLQAQLKQAQRTETTAYEAWQCELYGNGPNCAGASNRAGSGPIAQAKQQVYEQDLSTVNTLHSQIQARERVLTASNLSAAKARVREAKQNLPGAQALLNHEETTQAAEQAAFTRANGSAPDLLTRFDALNRLSAQNTALRSAQFLLALFVAALECLPATVMLLRRPGGYENAVETSRLPEARMTGSGNDAFRRRAVVEICDDGLPGSALSHSDMPGSPDEDSYDRAIRAMRDTRSLGRPDIDPAPRSPAA